MRVFELEERTESTYRMSRVVSQHAWILFRGVVFDRREVGFAIVDVFASILNTTDIPRNVKTPAFHQLITISDTVCRYLSSYITST